MAIGVFGGECVETHRVMIHDRGGTKRLHTLVDLTEVTWERVRDGKSSATIKISGKACAAQTDIIGSLEPSRHEMVIFRGDSRVWEGPIRVISTFKDEAVIVANDIKEYLDYTSLSKAWPGPDDGGQPLMGDRLEDIITYELSTPYIMETNQGTVTVPRWETIAAPINVLPYLDVRPGSVLTRSDTEAFQMTVGEHMDDLARGGLDYTVVGRKLLMWDTALSIGQTRKVTDADFYGDIEVGQYGTEHVSISHLSAQRAEDPGANPQAGVGHAGDENTYYGVWEAITSMDSEDGTSTPTQTALNSQAQRGLTHRTPVPIEVRVPTGAGIRLSHDLTIQDLVPGVVVPLVAQLNIRRLSQLQRIDKVHVTENATQESVQVSLSPFGEVVGV